MTESISVEKARELKRVLEANRIAAEKIRGQFRDPERVEEILRGIGTIGEQLLGFDPRTDDPSVAVWLLGKHAGVFEEVVSIISTLDRYDDQREQLRAIGGDVEAAVVGADPSADPIAATGGRR